MLFSGDHSLGVGLQMFCKLEAHYLKMIYYNPLCEVSDELASNMLSIWIHSVSVVCDLEV